MSKLLKHSLAILAVSAAGYAGLAAADDAVTTGSTGMTDMTSLDIDRDGQVSKKEASKDKGLSKKFSALDTNKDGRLDSSEFAQFEAPGSWGTGATSSVPANPYDTTPATPRP